MRSRFLVTNIFLLGILIVGIMLGTMGCENGGCGSDTTTDTNTSDATETDTDDTASTDTNTSDTTTDPIDPDRQQSPYPPVDPSSCGAWALTENVCCGQYCVDDPLSEDCSKCGGPGSPLCAVISGKACKSGAWPEVHEVSKTEPWHYSRSTHFGLTYAGACGFGLYGLCTTKFNFTDATLSAKCADFCDDYPDLCADPQETSLRGNFAAPQGNYYTQFWSSLDGERDNYLSCGECFEVIRTKKDGSEYTPGEAGYTKPVAVQIVDSCPCSANTKWCCGSGRDHCGEVSDFKYGCPTPPGDLDPDRDPSSEESIHLDLSDIAMSRLQTGDANGMMVDGVIPIKYRRIPCPVVGNIHVWMRSGSAYWFAINVVNLGGLGSVVKVEAQLPSGEWVALERDPNYTSSRPQERFGQWVLPQGAGPFNLPISLRISDASGQSLIAKDTIKSWPDPSLDPEGVYIDTGVQF